MHGSHGQEERSPADPTITGYRRHRSWSNLTIWIPPASIFTQSGATSQAIGARTGWKRTIGKVIGANKAWLDAGNSTACPFAEVSSRPLSWERCYRCIAMDAIPWITRSSYLRPGRELLSCLNSVRVADDPVGMLRLWATLVVCAITRPKLWGVPPSGSAVSQAERRQNSVT